MKNKILLTFIVSVFLVAALTGFAVAQTPSTTTPYFCDADPTDPTTYEDLVLKVDVNNKGEGDDEAWLPLDVIEVEVEFENDRDVDLDDIVIELGLFEDSNLTNNVIDDLDWISSDDEEVELGDVDEGEEDSHLFEFRIDPGELDSGDYFLAVKAYVDGDETETCISFSEDLADFGSENTYAEVEVETESDEERMVIIDDSDFFTNPINAMCGSSVSFTADVWNIGDEDFEEAVLVTLINNDLNINEREVILGDLDAGDDAFVTFNFDVPQDADEGRYTLSMRTYYDFDEDSNEDVFNQDVFTNQLSYEEFSEDTFLAYVNVEGNCGAVQNVEVSADVTRDAEAGEEMIVTATIENTANRAAPISLSVSGYSTWADSVSLSQNTFTLAAGEARQVIITFEVNEEASGQNAFSIDLVSEGQFVASQPVVFNIESKQGFFSRITGGIIGEGSGFIWGIAILNLILVIAIIVVAVKLLRR